MNRVENMALDCPLMCFVNVKYLLLMAGSDPVLEETGTGVVYVRHAGVVIP